MSDKLEGWVGNVLVIAAGSDWPGSHRRRLTVICSLCTSMPAARG